MSEKPDHVEIELIKAGEPDRHGNVFAADALRLLHDGERLFWDAVKGILFWRGPAHEMHEPHYKPITIPECIWVGLGIQ